MRSSARRKTLDLSPSMARALTRKSPVSGQAAASRRSAAEPGHIPCVRVLLGGGWFEEDFESEGFELADVVAFAAFGVGVGVVEVGAEVVEACLGVG